MDEIDSIGSARMDSGSGSGDCEKRMEQIGETMRIINTVIHITHN
jgi:26S proteasome regulatory subunit T6